ncbi:54S ribosomal protein, mitochondrial [Tulasnella sp. 403]|nr:54S ribosomal protein, mitochondrial [Tulasnella sp. 403]
MSLGIFRAPLRVSFSARHFSSTSSVSARLVSNQPSHTPVSPVSQPSNVPVYLPLSQFLPHAPGTPRARSKVVALDPTVFSHPIRRDILHACVVHYRDSLRQGSASTKSRGEVKCSGRKLRRQKGSGRARLGDAGSPMLRGGGRAFGPKPRDFSTKLNRKVREMGMRVALSAKLRERTLGIVESLQWPGEKTKGLLERLHTLSWPKVLFVSGAEIPESLLRCSNNIQGVECIKAEDLTVYDVVLAKRIVLDVAAVEWLEHQFSKLNLTALASLPSLEAEQTTATEVLP